MELIIAHYIEKLLRSGKYEYDQSVKEWVGWIEGYPGVYAQGKTVEDVRSDLIRVLEDFILLGVQEGKKIPSIPARSHSVKSKTHQRRYAAPGKS